MEPGATLVPMKWYEVTKYDKMWNDKDHSTTMYK